MSFRGVKIGATTKKVIIIDLSTQHCTLVVLKIAEKEIVNINGISSMPSNTNMVESLLSEQSEAALGNFAEYERNVKPFLVQNDTVSCGPIAALAFHFEYAGRTLRSLVPNLKLRFEEPSWSGIPALWKDENSSFRPPVVHDAGLGNFGCAPQAPQDPIHS